MSEPDSADRPLSEQVHRRASRVQRSVVSLIRLVMAISLALSIYERQWLNALLVLGIFMVMALPGRLGKRFKVHIPPEFELLALAFVFAAIFMGEVRGYYHRYWWWDIALHTSSGFLLGILGFLLVFVLNESERVDVHMRPRFVALFAFLFSVAMGTMWEIFEFTMDRTIGTNMQKPMLGDPSGLTDTMWDLIVDTAGAFVIGSLGWWHMRHRTRSFVDLWIRKFIESNPRLFSG